MINIRYLEEDSSVTVLERHRELVGYEVYVVEQWATSRAHPTFVITTYTGDPTHKAWVGVLSVPTDEASWSQRLRVYFKALNQYHARRKETPLGILMITNLSGFPSSLTVIPVPDGDLRKHRVDYFVNENLKRMGCSGRVGLSLSQPNAATCAKFHQLYRTSDKNPLYSSVTELVKLCQAALHLFDKLEIDYADGLLCDITEKAINDWWITIGAEFYNIEPHDGILGPTTVVSLLGLLMGARNRLHAINISTPKDPFDIQGMKRAIASFQKSQRLNKNRRLDRQTLDRLHRASAKHASSEGWSVPRAVKSTVAELSGKGGEMLADVVGRARDKAGIADIETSDMERFYQLVYGERCKWLWYGKPLKTLSIENDVASAPENRLELKPDENGGFTWTGRNHRLEKQDSLPPGRGGSEEYDPDHINHMASKVVDDDPSKDEHVPYRSIVKRATGLIMGRRGHRSNVSKDESPTSPSYGEFDEDGKRPSLWRSHTSPPVSPTSPRAEDHSLIQALEMQRSGRPASYIDPTRLGPTNNTLVQTPGESQQGFIPLGRQSLDNEDQDKDGSSSRQQLERHNTASTYLTTATEERYQSEPEPSIAGSTYHGIDLHEILPEPPTFAQAIGPLLRRTNSYNTFVHHRISKSRADDFYPRHLSFSLAEDSTTEKEEPFTAKAPERNAPLDEQFSFEAILSSDLKTMRQEIASLDQKDATWTRSQLFALRSLLDQADRDTRTIEQFCYPPLYQLQDLKDASAALLRDEKDALTEAGKELETIAARMEYEVGAMRGKIEDVEVGVQDFERAVGAVEDRVKELEEGEDKGGKLCIIM